MNHPFNFSMTETVETKYKHLLHQLWRFRLGQEFNIPNVQSDPCHSFVHTHTPGAEHVPLFEQGGEQTAKTSKDFC